MITAGELKHRVSIQSESTAVDSYGEPTGVWSTDSTVWASVKPRSANEQDTGDGQTGVVTTSIIMRYTEDASPKKRLVGFLVSASGCTIKITDASAIGSGESLSLYFFDPDYPTSGSGQTGTAPFTVDEDDFDGSDDNETFANNLKDAINDYPSTHWVATSASSGGGSWTVTVAMLSGGSNGNNTNTLTGTGWSITNQFTGGSERVFGIESVINVDERNEHLQLVCQEEVN